MYSDKLTQTFQNEVSGLIITGISGGAIIPLLIGVVSDSMESQAGALIVLLVCVMYLLFLISPKVKTNR